jgi:hypothetical protein
VLVWVNTQHSGRLGGIRVLTLLVGGPRGERLGREAQAEHRHRRPHRAPPGYLLRSAPDINP